LNLDRLERKLPIMWFYEMSFWLVRWKKSEEMKFLSECCANSLAQKLMDLERAFRDGFNKNKPRKRLPHFRKKELHNSFRHTQGIKIDNRRIYIPKVGWIGFFKSCEIEGKIKNTTISKDGKHWYASIQTEIEAQKSVHKKTSIIGGHMGVNQFLTLSNGTIYPPLNTFKKYQEKFSREQRKLSKKKKGSKNREKQREKVQKIHTKIRNSRKDYLHKISADICKNHASIYIDEMKIMSLMQLPKGTLSNNKRSDLNRAILEQGWYEFRRQLQYKSVWLGGQVITVNSAYTSQKCSNCNCVDEKNRRSWSKFICRSCSFSLHADVNAARNILAAGHAVSVCGEEALVSSMKQKLLRSREIVVA